MNPRRELSAASPSFRRVEKNLYFFTALQNAGYVVFLLLYLDYFTSCVTDTKAAVWIETSILFAAVLLGNVYSIYAGFESDARGHGRGIRKSFDFGVIHGLILALLPWMLPWGLPSAAALFLLFLAVLFQAVSSAYVNASYHAWFVASIHNLGYTGTLQPFTSRRRLVANLVWLLVGVPVIWFLPLIVSDLHIRITISGLVIAALYLVGAVKIRALIWSQQDIGAFETSGDYSSKGFAQTGWQSFKLAVGIIRQDAKVLYAAALWVVTWTLGVMVLYFWKDALLAQFQSSTTRQSPSAVFATWAGLIWVLMTIGRVIGNWMAVMPDAASTKTKDNRLRLGGLLNGLPMVVYAVWLLAAHSFGDAFFLNQSSMIAAILAVLLIVLNRVGQEIVMPFAYARLHESTASGIAQNRAALESLLAVGTSVPLLLTWLLIIYLEQMRGIGSLVLALVFGALGCLVIFTVLNKRLLSAAQQSEPSTK